MFGVSGPGDSCVVDEDIRLQVNCSLRAAGPCNHTSEITMHVAP